MTELGSFEFSRRTVSYFRDIIAFEFRNGGQLHPQQFVTVFFFFFFSYSRLLMPLFLRSNRPQQKISFWPLSLPLAKCPVVVMTVFRGRSTCTNGSALRRFADFSRRRLRRQTVQRRAGVGVWTKYVQQLGLRGHNETS